MDDAVYLTTDFVASLSFTAIEKLNCSTDAHGTLCCVVAHSNRRTVVIEHKNKDGLVTEEEMVVYNVVSSTHSRRHLKRARRMIMLCMQQLSTKFWKN